MLYALQIMQIFLWNGSKIQLLGFVRRLNSRHPTILFDFKYLKSTIDFLQAKSYKKQREEQIANNNLS